MAEGGALLRRYMGLNPYRGFESLSLRQIPLLSVLAHTLLLGAPALFTLGAGMGNPLQRLQGAMFCRVIICTAKLLTCLSAGHLAKPMPA